MAALTLGLAEAKNNFSKVTAEVNRTGRPVTVLKNNKPWVVIPSTSWMSTRRYSQSSQNDSRNALLQRSRLGHSR